MTAHIIDGKAIAADLRGQVADAVHRLVARPRHHAGPRGRAGRQQSGERGLCRQQGEADRRQRHAVVRPPPAGDHAARPSCWRWSAGSTPIRPCTASWCSCRCRSRSTRSKVIAAIDPAKDVDGFHPVNAGRLVVGPAGAGALHAARLRACSPRRCTRRSPASKRW